MKRIKKLTYYLKDAIPEAAEAGETITALTANVDFC